MKPLKEAKDYSGQLDAYQKNHALQINDEASAISIISHVNFYRLSAYGIGLTRPENRELYQEGVTMEHLFRLYQFDARLRALLFSAVENLEIDLRAKISYHLAITYGSEGYMDHQHFITKKKGNGSDIYEDTIAKFQHEVKRQNRLPCVKHHLEKYGGHFPAWAAIELFTFGMLSSLFSVMKPEDQKAVSKAYGTTPEYLSSWILSLLDIRNRCAHYGRIYNMPFSQQPRLHTEYKPYGGNKLFPVLLVIKRMTNTEKEWCAFHGSLLQLIEEYPEANLSFMGFPVNWQTVLSAGRYSAR